MKKTTFKRWLGILTILFAQTLLGQSIEFQSGSFYEAQQLAKKENKPLFLDVYTTWCQPCKWMEKTVFSNPDVGKYLNSNFISYRVNAETQEPSLVKELGVEAYPTLVFYTPSGIKSVQQIGALDADQFLSLAKSLVNIQSYFEAYTKKSDDIENIHDFSMALNWQNPKKAHQIARSYLLDLDQKKYDDSLNWKLIQTFVSATDHVLFPRVISNEHLLTTYPVAFKEYIRLSLTGLLQESIEKPSSTLLKKYLAYVGYNSVIFSNPDSVKLVANMAYAQRHDIVRFLPLLQTYVSKYESKNPLSQALIAYQLSENNYRSDILEYSIALAKESLNTSPNATAHFAQAIAYEKLNKFKLSYAHVLLAYEFADEDTKLQLDQYEQKLKSKLAYELNEGVNTIIDQEGTDDGRFTLGSGTKRLMYGYPVPKSTSHFVVNINGKLASNASHFSPSLVTKLKGQTIYSGAGNTPTVLISFHFEGVKITQSLVPVDKTGKEIVNGLAQYYEVSYVIENESDGYKLIGLNILFDTMIDDNDFCAIAADGRLIKNEIHLVGNHIPSSMLFYRTAGDTSDHMGAAIIKGLKATPPDRMIVGNWPMFYNITWALRTSNIPYGDSAYLLQWEKKRLGPNGKMKFTTYYGLPAHKQPTLQILLEENTQLSLSTSIYFQHERSDLDLNAKMKIGDLLSDQNILITGVLLNGYADITGNRDFNFELSQKRIQNVGAIFKAYNIPFVPKPYGIDQADNNDYNLLYGNVWDRRVEMIIYYRKRTQQAMDQVSGL